MVAERARSADVDMVPGVAVSAPAVKTLMGAAAVGVGGEW